MLLSALLLAGFVGVYASTSRLLLQAATSTQQLATQSMLETVRLQGASPVANAIEFEEEFRELSTSLAVVEATLWGAKGERLAQGVLNAHHSTASRLGAELEAQGHGAALVMTQRTPIGDGLLVVSRSLHDLGATKRILARMLLWMGPLVVLAAMVTGWFLAGRALHPAERAFASQRTFMADASHELRTPLSIARAHAELAIESLHSPDIARSAFKAITHAVDDMATLSAHMLMIARLDGDPHGLILSRLALAELVGDGVFELRVLAHKHKMQIAYDEPEVDIFLEGDGAQLRRLLTLLVDNAIQHARVGTIRISLSAERKHVFLLVEDEGPGMPESLMNTAFERFVRGPAPAQQTVAGHGLGLALAQSIVQAHGGLIALARSRAGGLGVHVRLPK